MVDPLDRRSFEKPGPMLAEFQKTVKEIKAELNDLLKTLFFSTDLEKRKFALKNICNMKKRFQVKLERVANHKKEDLFTALQIDVKKIENALKGVSVHIFMEIEGIHVPLHSRETKKPFNLFEFLDDPHMLEEREVWFQYHLPKMNPEYMGSLLPGFDDPHFVDSFQAKGRLKLPFTFNYSGIDYFLSPAQPNGSYHVEGNCCLKKLNHLVKFEIPHGVMPADLNSALDKVLRETNTK
jgi:hypothetical protein